MNLIDVKNKRGLDWKGFVSAKLAGIRFGFELRTVVARCFLIVGKVVLAFGTERPLLRNVSLWRKKK
jgi:hypothetical protein